MPKMKSHRGAAKRFKVLKSGRIKRAKAYRRHILNKKTSKRKRHLRKATYFVSADIKNIKRLLPYA
ncbi:MAG: 50S ribosomal protein L35 [Thermoanaerobacteraceae bacterium]